MSPQDVGGAWEGNSVVPGGPPGSQGEASADPELVAQLPRTRPRTRCYVGGPGWDLTQLPPSVVALGSLSEVSNVLTSSAGL